MKKCFDLFKLIFLSGLLLFVSSCAILYTNTDTERQINNIANESVSDNLTNNIVSVSSSQDTTDFTKLYQDTFESVVTVLVSDGNIGTGFIVNSQEGYVMTSSSLFADGNVTPSEIVLSDGSRYDVILQGVDSVGMIGRQISANSDIALLKIVQMDEAVLPASVIFTNDDSLTYGDDCYTIATSVFGDKNYLNGLLDSNIISNPYNSHDSSFYYSDGEMFFDESLDYLIQTGLTSNKGNKGAPLFNKFGQVVGLINQRVNETVMYKSNDPIGITFATPSSVLCNYLENEGIEFSFSELNTADTSDVVINADSLQKATDRVADVLMGNSYGSDDYFVVSGNSNNKIIINSVENAKANTVNSFYTSSELAEYSFNKCVKIIVYSEQTAWLGKTTPSISEGSGFLINKDGYVLTNLHVINKLAGSNQKAGKLANSTVDIDGI